MLASSQGLSNVLNWSELAKKTADEMGVRNVSFKLGNMEDLDWSQFTSFYLYNPFYEHEDDEMQMDTTISHDRSLYGRYIEVVRSQLGKLPSGTRVATYHGFGGEMPLSYKLTKKVPIGTNFLELWVKTDFTRAWVKGMSENVADMR